MNHQPAYYSVLRVRFEFRPYRGKVTTPTPEKGTLYAVIYVEGQPPVWQSSGIRCHYADWKTSGDYRKSSEAKATAEKMLLWERSLELAARTLIDRGDPVTAKTLMDEKNRVNQPLLTVEQVMTKFLAYKKSRIGPDNAAKRSRGQITYDTFRTYGIRHAWLSRYLNTKHTTALLMLKVDAPFIQRYHAWLENQPTLGAAYATKCVKLLTELCQWAFNEGLIRELRTGGFRGSGEAESKPFNLTEAEVCRIEAIPLPTTLGKVRDGWLLARELCLHYGDYRSLKSSDFHTDEKTGEVFLDKARQKQEAGRDIRMLSVVSERALRIWHQYGETIPAKMSNPEFSRYLKEIGPLANLERPLIFSHARDSGLFRLIVLGKSEIELTMAAGWTTNKQLSRYVKRDRRLLEELTKPTSPTSGGELPNRSQPFLHIHRTS